MSNDAWSWSPDRPENPQPIHGPDRRIPRDVRANVPFQEQDDPEGAQNWLDTQLDMISQSMAGQERAMRSIPFDPRNVRPPEEIRTRESQPRYPGVPWPMTNDTLDTEEVRNRVAELPYGELNPYGRWAGPAGPPPNQLPGETAAQWMARHDRAESAQEPVTIAMDPVAGEPAYMNPHDGVPRPSPETVERPNFPVGPLGQQVMDVTISVRTRDGFIETYVIDDPDGFEFRMNVDREFMTIGTPSGFVEQMPVARRLRELVIAIWSPRNWRRLPTRRWR